MKKAGAAIAIGAVISALGIIPRAFACSVCFGDPNSNMSKGVIAGVLLLFGVTALVLGCVAATIFIWIRRAKKISQFGGHTP